MRTSVTFCRDAHGKIITVEIRFAFVGESPGYVEPKDWNFFLEKVSTFTNGLAHVASSSFLFEAGILSLAISSESANYNESYITSICEWITTDALTSYKETGSPAPLNVNPA